MRADVAVEVADDEVELGGGDAQPGHRHQDTGHGVGTAATLRT